MRFFASWWEKFPVRDAAPAALVVVLVGLSFSSHVVGFIRALLHGATGYTWG